jgi:hypothetical protein
MHESADKAPPGKQRPESSNLVNVPSNGLAARGDPRVGHDPLSI